MTRSRITLVAFVSALVAAGVVVGCNDECQRAKDREIECVGSRSFDAGPPVDCTDIAECQAQCIDNADGGPTPDCDEVVAFLRGDMVKGKVIFDCIKGCSSVPPPVQ